MKFLRGGLVAGLSLASLVVLSPQAVAVTSAGDADGPPMMLTELNPSSTEAMMATPAAVSAELSALNAANWTFWAGAGGALGVQQTSSPDGGAATVEALEGTYPIPASSGGNYVGAAYHLSAVNPNLEDVYIEFWAKMPGAKEGCKFVKIFGRRTTSSAGYADTTFATDYTGVDYGALRQVSFGDGRGVQNDSQDVIALAGAGTHLGTQSSTAVVNTPQGSAFSSADWGTGWHHFLIHVKFNSVTSTNTKAPDGEYFLQIDGKVYVDATGLYNRNPANGPIDQIQFFGWAQTESQPFQVWYHDIRISTGGFMSTPLPDAPANPAVK